MSIVLSLVNQKGGVCKSTNSINIADGLAALGYNVLLGDLDEGQDSAMIFGTLNEDCRFTIKGVPQERVVNFIERHRNDYDYIVLDCPPRNNSVAFSVITNSDLVLLPVSPSPMELWSLRNIAKTVTDRQIIGDGIPVARVLLSRCKKNAKLVGKSVKVINDLGLEPMQSGTTEMEIYKQTFEEGESVFTELKEFNGLPLKTAQKQVEAIVQEIIELMGVPSNVEENKQ